MIAKKFSWALLLRSAIFVMVLGFSLRGFSSQKPECSAYPQLNQQIFQTALSNLLSLDYIRHAIDSDKGEGIEFCTQAIILGSNVYKYGLFYFQISVVNSSNGREIRNYNFLYQDASTQANHNSRFFNWVGLSAVDAKEKFSALVQDSKFTKTQIAGAHPNDESAMIKLIKSSKHFNDEKDDETTLSSMKIEDNLYLFTWLDRSYNSFAQTQLINSVMIRIDDQGKYELSANRFLYSELRVPLIKAVEQAQAKITKNTQVSDYLKLISSPEDIISVLINSAWTQLKSFKVVPSADESSMKLQASFDRIRDHLTSAPPVELVVVEGPLGAQAIMNSHLVVSKAWADQSEGERNFVLAHEMGHIMQGHFGQLCDLYKKHIPDKVTKEITDRAFVKLGPEAREQAFRHEFEADAFAFKEHKKMGFDLDSAVRAIRLSPYIRGDATHPAAAKRIMQIRMLNAED